MPPLSYCVHTHLATPLHPTPPICSGRSCIHPLPHLSSTSAILILYGGDVDASTRRWRPSSLLSLYFTKGHSDAFPGCLGTFLGAREELQRAVWQGVERLRGGCIRPSAWVVLRPLHPSSSLLCHVLFLIFLPGCAIQLLWMRLPVRDPLLLRSFWGRKLGQVRVGSSFNASAVSVWLLPPCFQLLSTELQLHLPVFTVLLLLNFASPICYFRTIAKSSP